jgi:hypothetical protein
VNVILLEKKSLEVTRWNHLDRPSTDQVLIKGEVETEKQSKKALRRWRQRLGWFIYKPKSTQDGSNHLTLGAKPRTDPSSHPSQGTNAVTPGSQTVPLHKCDTDNTPLFFMPLGLWPKRIHSKSTNAKFSHQVMD